VCRQLRAAAIACALFYALTPSFAQAPRGTLLVSHSGESSVGFYDAATGKSLAALATGRGPHEITVSRDSSTAYIAISGAGPSGAPGNTITVVDLKRRAVKATFTLADCRQPHDTRISRDGRRLWVACAPAQATLELDARTGDALRTLKTNLDGGWFVEATPDGRKLYVPHLEGKAISVVDVESGAARALYSGSTQFGIAIAPDGREVWVSDRDRQQLSIIDTATDTITAGVMLDPPPQGQSAFARLRFTPDGRSVAVVRGAQMMLIDARKRAIAWTLDLPHAGKVLTISPDGRFAAVSHPGADRVSIIDLSARSVLSTLATGKAPDGVAWLR